ncbi:hypothetical protein ABZ342_44135 [Amycolatopsis sp. NPDC005961]|uniref:hypothetical protein n=1 Tax=Amycolatopsis sp. NPDC005961 TaxID=3156720 RepID=UPI0033FFCFED
MSPSTERRRAGDLADEEADRAQLVQLAALVREGSLRVPIGSRHSLADVPKAFSAGRQGGGKPIVVVDES